MESPKISKYIYAGDDDNDDNKFNHGPHKETREILLLCVYIWIICIMCVCAHMYFFFFLKSTQV